MKPYAGSSPFFGGEDIYYQHPFFHHRRPPRRPDTSSPPAALRPPARSVVTVPVCDPSDSPVVPAPSRPSLDPSIAATRIQACFRGFSARRHKPLSLLRTIASVCRQLNEIQAEIDNPRFVQKIRSNDKERLRVSETIMTLLLRLDSVQASMPEIRSRRKEATRKAIFLQDSIDAMNQHHEGDGHNRDLQADMVHLPCDSTHVLEPSSVADTSDNGHKTDSLDASTGPLNSIDDDFQDEAQPRIPALCLENENFVSGESAVQCPLTVSEYFLPLNVTHAADTSATESVPSLDGLDLAVNVDHTNLLLKKHDHTSPEKKTDEESKAFHMENEDLDLQLTTVGYEGIEGQCPSQLQGCSNACIDAADGDQSVPNVPLTTELESSIMCVDGLEVQQEGSMPHLQVQHEEHGTHTQGCTNVCLDGMGPTEVKQKEPISEVLECANVFLHKMGNQRQQKEDEYPEDGGRNVQSSQELLQQMADDCNQLKFLIGKLIRQTRAQNKAICELNSRIEVLEHKQHQQQQSRRKADKRKGSNKKTKRPVIIRGFPYDEAF